ncbi:MAG: hypothetical protein Q9164_006485, partial [Protoblastenia rupestris]
MKTSRLARETAKVAATISSADPLPRRRTRAFAASLHAFTPTDLPLNRADQLSPKPDAESASNSSLSSIPSHNDFDIEDSPFGTPLSRKRKGGFDSPATAITTISTATSTRASPRKANIKSESTPNGKTKKAKRQSAKRVIGNDGEVKIEAPTKWDETYDLVKEMRKERSAPVDTMG